MIGSVSDTYEIPPLDCTYPSGSFGAVHRFNDSILIVSVCHYYWPLYIAYQYYNYKAVFCRTFLC
jgi:hypothetical protein